MKKRRMQQVLIKNCKLLQEKAEIEGAMSQQEGLIQQRLANAALMLEIEQIEAWKKESATVNAGNQEQPTVNQVNSRLQQQRHLSPHFIPFEAVNLEISRVHIAIDRDSPLLERLQRALYPNQFGMGAIIKFRGDSDLCQFLMSYETIIASIGGDEITLAKVFACALEGAALTWYFNLPLRSIYSWKNLRDKVISNFKGFKSIEEPLQKLKNLRQHYTEPLQDY